MRWIADGADTADRVDGLVAQAESGVDVAEGEVGLGLADLVDQGAARLAVAGAFVGEGRAWQVDLNS
ncbi:hypothetical protein ACF08M_37385 [Streptomyces sp. NPDC015032]|uniref:hypothetical protein n=1 Tax=Streptomyces sp. NPDC015032 TaxID=3364937 RepID=UPI0036F73E7D